MNQSEDRVRVLRYYLKQSLEIRTDYEYRFRSVFCG